MMRRRPPAATAVLLGSSLLISQAANGGAPSVDCNRPFVFSDGWVNLVVLPFVSTIGPRASHTADELPLLIQANGLFLMLKYRGVGAINLVGAGSEEECSPEVVLPKLLGAANARASGTVANGHGLIMVWGVLYEEGGNIFVQTYMRFLRKGITEQFAMPMGDWKFTGRLASQAVAFAPRILTTADLAAVESTFREAVTVREGPSESARPANMQIYDPYGHLRGYRVMEQAGDWIRVQPFDYSGSGWVRASLDVGHRQLGELLPELHFIELATAYLYSMAAEVGAGKPVSEQSLKRARAALEKYLAMSGEDAAPLAAAVAKQMVGALAGSSVATSDNLSLSVSLFEDAAALIPYSSAAKSCAAAQRCRLEVSERGYPVRPVILEDRMVAALALEPSNAIAYRNLESFYEWMHANEPPNSSAQEIIPPQVLEARLQNLQRMKSVPFMPEH